MRFHRIILGTATVAALLTPALATAAQAEPVRTQAEPVQAQGVLVTVGRHVGNDILNVRSGPTLGSKVVGGVRKGDGLDGLCWAYGDDLTRWGVRNNIWVKTVYGYPPAYAWVWAGGLAGNETGNVPNRC